MGDGMIVYAFNNELSAISEARKRYANYIKAMFAQSKPIRNGGVLILSLTGLTPAQIAALKLCGYRKNKIEMSKGLTFRYIDVIKAYQHDNWYFPKLKGEYMDGVSGYVEMELPKDWLPPSPITLSLMD